MSTRLIYASQAAYDLAPEELVELLERSRTNNQAAGLSGMLLYSGQSFLQLLEGEDRALEEAYARIAADERHRNLRVLMRDRVTGPMFPDWTMGFEHVEEEELSTTLTGYTPATEYPLVNPDLVNNAGVAQTLFKLYAKNRV